MDTKTLRCGLLGRKLGHSYSPAIHERLADYSYRLFEVEPEDLGAFLQEGAFDGLNVTIPYKKDVIPYCAELSDTARAIGAVNTLVRRADGTLWGDNTDAYGFSMLVQSSGADVAGKKALVFGSGGASATAQYVLRQLGAREVVVISRHGEDNYENLDRHADAQIAVNTTPVGMYPNTGVSPVDLHRLPRLEAALDVVYNPEKTEIILRAEEAGVPVAASGLEMLVAQAVYAAEYFLDRKFEDAPAEISRVTAAIRRDTLNVVLIGMPSSGKSTIGRMLAEKLGKRFIDLDDEVVKADGRTIPEIFAAEGEDSFRRKETEQTARFAKEGRQLLSCGGGVIKRPENIRLLHQNGVILFLDRPLEALTVGGGRPLSSSTDALRAMYTERRPLYLAAADAVVPNHTTVTDAVNAAMEALDEIFDH